MNVGKGKKKKSCSPNYFQATLMNYGLGAATKSKGKIAMYYVESQG